MDFSTGQFIQLALAMLIGTSFLAAAYTLPERIIIWVLLVMIPFQPIDSRFGSLNEFMVLAVAGIFFLRGRMRKLPLIGAVVFIFMAYVLSLSQAFPGTFRQHVLYLLAIVSNFAMFWMVYNFVLREGRWQTIISILGVLNVLVIGYCILQVIFGAERFVLVAGTDLMINTTADGSRITGPFQATAMTAEYLTIQVLIWGYCLIHQKAKGARLFLITLVAVDLALLVGTGNRGGIVTITLGSLLFLYFFRKDMGSIRALKIAAGGIVFFAIAAFIMVNFTEFGTVFDRLAGTEFEEGFVPDSRTVWIDEFDKIISKPIIGHGPRLNMPTDLERSLMSRGYVPVNPPHNLYMWLMYTIGTIGLIAYANFFFLIWRRFARARNRNIDDAFLAGLPKLGLLILIVFLVSEMRMELMRWILHDYQQYFFMLIGALLAFSDIAWTKDRRAKFAKAQRAQSNDLSSVSPGVP